ncbi:ATP-binding cassette domain-containing protein [Thalassoglobus sp.]|uniref:ATP-binding cassette domain-containing protein n=1 Tax=Thalassoglobus sp. TaxID=2795869 RepID=UPI003AA90526
MISLSDVSKQFSGTTALFRMSLSIPEKRTCVLLGTSGCGKSTILRMLLGLIPPTTGTISFDGKPLSEQPIEHMRHRIGYVIQDGGLFPNMSAAENVAIVARYLGWKQERINSRVSELLELVRLSASMLGRRPTELSGGQRQRVGLMRALMLDPPVLLLDEPLGALDPIIRSELQKDLREIFESLHKTVVMVTHDLHEAAYFADMVVLLDSGHVVQKGTISDLVERPATDFAKRFVSAQQHVLTRRPQ